MLADRPTDQQVPGDDSGAASADTTLLGGLNVGRLSITGAQ